MDPAPDVSRTVTRQTSLWTPPPEPPSVAQRGWSHNGNFGHHRNNAAGFQNYRLFLSHYSADARKHLFGFSLSSELGCGSIFRRWTNSGPNHITTLLCER